MNEVDVNSPLIPPLPGLGKLIFSDEFLSDGSIDDTKWLTRYIYADGTLDFLNDEVQRYRAENLEVKKSALEITCKKDSSIQSGYSSGLIRSRFTFRYGYIEGRFKFPKAKGSWPAFWLNSDSGLEGKLQHPPEIDIFEQALNYVEDRANMLHLGLHGKQPQNWIYAPKNIDPVWSNHLAPDPFYASFHTIGILWEPERVTWYVDGTVIAIRKYTWVYDGDELAAPAHILINYALGGGWAGRYGIDDASLPDKLYVDWVRVWALDN